jgi:diguanylate cyclase (GGDEF)-like protein
VFIGGLILLELLLSQWRQREKSVEILSQIDPLTTLYNRRTIYNFLEILLSKQYTDHRFHALILLDLDYFKQINDKYGHTVGDKALIETANVLKRTIRNEDIVGRFGGEEFIIVVANTSHQQTQQIAERCRNELARLKVYSDHDEEVMVTASFGITHFDRHITSLDTVLKQADEALYHAKNLGRNQVVQYQDYLKQTGEA